MTDQTINEGQPDVESTRDADHRADSGCCGGGDKSRREKLEERIDELDRKFSQFKRDSIRFVLERTDPDFAEHMGNSGREFLLAMRTFIDKEIGHIDKSVKKCRDIHEEKQAGREKEKAGV